MQRKPGFYWQLFLAAFSLSAFTFGGGYVIVTLMRKRFVEEKKWISEQDMLDIVAIGQSAPGVIAVNTSILAGYRLAGISGALLCTLGTVLPPLIIITVLSFFYEAFRSNPAVAAVMKAMQAGVAAVIIDAVLSMGKTAAKDRGLAAYILMTACFAASFVFHLNTAAIIFCCAALGTVTAFIRKPEEKGGEEP